MLATVGDLHDDLAGVLGGRVHVGAPLARYTSLRVGGPADVLAVPETVDELVVIVRAAVRHGACLTVLGNGSNVLIADAGIAGVVVRLGRGFIQCDWRVTEDGAFVRTGAAMPLARLARVAVKRGLAGLEYAEGIPASVGGAILMNAGAYGGTVGTAVETVEGVDARGTVQTVSGASLAFDYRRSSVPAGFIVTAVTFRLLAEDPVTVRDRMATLQTRRQESQPGGAASAGSIFKNPDGDHAGRLIEAAGLKTRQVGGARISEVHANFIVNEGGASAGDVKALMDLAQRAVWERSGVWLEPEVRLVGRW